MQMRSALLQDGRVNWFAAIAMSILVLPCASGSAKAQASLEAVKAAGQATIAMDNFLPLMKLEPDGTLTGAGVDIDRAVLNRIGVKNVKGDLTGYSGLIPSVQAERATLGSGGALYITPERCKAVLFSEPVLCLAEAFVVRKDLAGKIKTYKDVADNGLRIALCGGCVYEKYALNAGVPQAKIVYWPDKESGLKMLQDGRVDVVAVEMIGGLESQAKSAKPELSQVVRATDIPLMCTGAIFNRRNTTMRDAYNDGLRQLVADGTYRTILKKYGLEEVADARTGTTEQYCAAK